MNICFPPNRPAQSRPFGWPGLWLLACSILGLAFTLPQTVSASPNGDKTYIVNSAADTVSGGEADGECIAPGDGLCTLREAIKEANANSGGATTLQIVSPVPGVLRVQLSLGTLTITGNQITIDGTSGAIVDGAQNPDATDLFSVQGSQNTLNTLVLLNSRRDGIVVGDPAAEVYPDGNQFTKVVIAGSAGSAIAIHHSRNTQVSSSWIGFGTIACDPAPSNAGEGIRIDSGSQNTRLSGNSIRCSGANGVLIDHSSATQLSNNEIGVTSGRQWGVAVGNRASGVKDYFSTQTVLDSNAIAANSQHGIWLQGSAQAVLIRNRIGTSLDGKYPLANGGHGVYLNTGANSATIGSFDDPSLYNLIGANAQAGIALEGGAYDNLIATNRVGLNVDGSALPNGGAGALFADGAHDNRLLQGEYRYNHGAGIAVIGTTSIHNMIAPTSVVFNAGLPVDLGNDGATPNGSQANPGPNHWLPYPRITTRGDSTITGTACNYCWVFIYQATGNPAASRGGGQRIGSVTASAAGEWSYALPIGLKVNDLSLMTCKGELSGDCSEMSPRPVIYIPRVER